MKILLIFILHLISGGAAGTDVIGILGGRVTITFKHNVYDPVRQTVAGYLGETVTISCSYPEEFESHTKYFYKRDGHLIPMTDTTETQRGRFSISDDRRSKVLSVRISDVREADGGVYYCGVWNKGESVSYQSFYTEIQLQVTETPLDTTDCTTAKPGSTTPTNPSGSSNIITICVCVALLLLLIGELTLIFLRCIQAKASVITRPPTNNTVSKESEIHL
ncbi:hypothetical protein SRHO_G00177870 [Serrasalmus rhombeus]